MIAQLGYFMGGFKLNTNWSASWIDRGTSCLKKLFPIKLVKFTAIFDPSTCKISFNFAFFFQPTIHKSNCFCAPLAITIAKNWNENYHYGLFLTVYNPNCNPRSNRIVHNRYIQKLKYHFYWNTVFLLLLAIYLK